jgi:PAS domain S-box-containing protein
MTFRTSPFFFVLIFLVLSAGIGLSGYLYFQNAKEYIKKEKQDDLSAIADLKVNQIAEWRKERLDNAAVIFENPIMVSNIYNWLEKGRSAELRGKLLEWMSSLQKHYDHKSVILLDPKGNIQLAVSDDKEILGPDARRLAEEAIKAKKAVFSDIYRSKITDAVRITLVVPILISKDKNTIPVGTLLFRIDPYKFLYPLIQSWPAPSLTAETLLAHREGSEVVFISELRHIKGTALKLRFKITEEKLPAAMAVRNVTGIVEGVDYRGVPVLAALRPIPDSPWFMVAKIDREEVYSPIRERLWFLIIILTALIISTGLGLAFVWRRKELELTKREEENVRKLNNELEQQRNELTRMNRELESEVAERKEAEKTILKERNFSESVINSLPGIFYLFDEKGGFVRWNKNFEEVSEYSAPEINNMTPMDFFSGDEKQSVLEKIQKVFTGGHSEVEACLTSKSGRRTPYFFTGLLIIIDDKPYLIGVGIDITERRRAEETLNKTLAELERSNKELEQFAYIASHDLQEPLRMVSSYLQLITGRYKGRLDADADDFIHYAVDGANRMQTMINDLLAYSRVGTKGRPFEPADCNGIIEQTLFNLKFPIEETGAVITHDLLPVIKADASQLVQVFQNLISNAIKFRGERTPEVHISTDKKGGEWIFSVKDNGIGFDPKYADKIFDTFKRLHTAVKYPGSGIGLTICRKIIERHGGRIWAESEPGKGAAFYFTIPDGNIKQVREDD